MDKCRPLLAGSKRAITVLSLPKYPAPDVLPDFQPLYQNTRPLNAVPTSDRLRAVGPDCSLMLHRYTLAASSSLA